MPYKYCLCGLCVKVGKHFSKDSCTCTYGGMFKNIHDHTRCNSEKQSNYQIGKWINNGFHKMQYYTNKKDKLGYFQQPNKFQRHSILWKKARNRRVHTVLNAIFLRF